jgi:hypothetical protein
MPDETPRSAMPPGPITSLDDPRTIQILSTEHWSLLAHRQLAYNEAFVRGGMFLTFLSMSFVALALLAQGMTFGDDFLTVAAIVLAFDFVIGVTTYGRILGANVDDLRSVHGMARIRHGYTEAAPIVTRYFTSPTHDDPLGIGLAYGNPTRAMPGVFFYGLTTSGGMIGLILSMVGGVLIGVLALLFGVASGGLAVWFGLGGAILVFVAILLFTLGSVPREQSRLPSLFPTPDPTATGSEPEGA